MARRFLSNVRINDAYTLPASDGTNNQVIKTDGSGNLTFGQLAADSASVIYKDTFTGDGSTTAFTMANALNDENQSNIYIDGVYQSKSTYSVANKVITFSTAPASGHAIEVISTTGINSGPTAIFTDNFTANGSATAFTLGQTVHDENQTLVFLNGVYQFKNTYSLSGTTLTLDTAPANGVAIEVMSIGSAYSGGDILYDHDFTSAGLMKTNGSGTYSIVTDNSSNWNTAYTYSQVGHLPLAGGTVTGNLIVSGNLTVDGTQTILNTQTVEVEDNILQLNTTQGSPDTATATTSGISIYRGNGVTQASFIFDDADDTWDLTNNLVVAGDISIPDKLIHSGDTNTYLQFQTDRQTYLAGGVEFIDFANTTQDYITIGGSSDIDTRMQGGSGYIFIQGSNGYIGINDASPSYPLEVVGNTNIGGELYTTGNVGIKNTVASTIDNASALGTLVVGDGSSVEGITIYTGTGNYGGLNFADATSGGGAYAGYIKFDHSNNSFGHYIGNTVRLTIDSSGNATFAESVVIGTSINTGIPLVVQETTADGFAIGFMRNTNSTNGNGLVIDVNSTGGSYIQDWRQGGGVKMRLLQNGNLGIGTTNINGNLQFSNDAETRKIVLYEGANNDYQFYGFGVESQTLVYSTYTTGDDHVFFAGTGSSSRNELMRIGGDGKVGIGTTTPNEKLVVGTTGGTQNIEISNSYIQSFNRSGSPGYATMDFYASNYTFNISDVLIGTHGKFLQGRRSTGSAIIDMIGFGAGTDNLQIKGGTSGGANAISFYDTNGFLGTFYNSNFGIGIGTPQTTLQVNGSASALNAHFGQGTNNSSGVFGGISLGYSEGGNASYRKVGIVAKAVGDGAARQDLHFLVDTVSDSGSAGIADSKMSIAATTGYVTINERLGVGTTSPSGDVDIAGPYLFLGTENANNGTTYLTLRNYDSTLVDQNDVPNMIRMTSRYWSGAASQLVETRITHIKDSSNGNGGSALGFMTQTGGDSPVEHMRINKLGDVIIGGTGVQLARTASFDIGTNNIVFDNCTTSGAGNGAEYQTFRRHNGSNSVQIGSIVMNGTSGVTYGTSSDYRLKENVVELTNALDRVDQLKPSRFNFISDEGRTIDGFLAHEVQDIVPEAIVGTKDEVDEDGNPKYQSIDQSKLVPLLVGAIKELKAEIEQLKTQIDG